MSDLDEVHALLHQLEDLFAQYGRQAERENAGFHIGRLFRHWVSYEPGKMDSVCQTLLDGVKDTVEQLTVSLRVLSETDPAAAEQAAITSVRLLLIQDEQASSSESALFFQAVAPECEPLLEFLPRVALAQIRKQLLEKTPQKMMFPKERVLLSRIESLLR